MVGQFVGVHFVAEFVWVHGRGLSVRIIKPTDIRTDTVRALPYISARIAGKAGMPKWKKDATEFTVGVSYSEDKGVQTRIPKPVVEALGKPDTITYSLKGKKVEVRAGSQSDSKKSKSVRSEP